MDRNTILELMANTVEAQGLAVSLKEKSRWGLRGLHDKEPETLAWIDDMDPDNDMLLDLGANVGVFSVYAALRGLTVLAVEPSPENLQRLMQIAWALKVADKIVPMLAAVGDGLGWKTKVWPLPDNMVGENVLFAKSSDHVDPWAVLMLSLPELLHLIQYPKNIHIKMDIEGNEAGVLERLMWSDVLHIDSRPKSILVETTRHTMRRCETALVRLGFVPWSKYGIPQIPNHSNFRRSKDPGNTTQNDIWIRATHNA